MKLSKAISTALLALLSLAYLKAAGFARRAPKAARTPAVWQTPAEWRHGLRKFRGTLRIGLTGVKFQPARGLPLFWSYENIESFHLRPRSLDLVSYQNRSWHLPGNRSFHFRWRAMIPPNVAAALATRVGKPSENDVPFPAAPAFAVLAARHPTRDGGTNGVLRFRSTGIDYVTPRDRGARSWRWADIKTIARLDPYHFQVGAYREIFNFELKQPMPRSLFERLWNLVYARRLGGLRLDDGGTSR
jgi:hypothetical protein